MKFGYSVDSYMSYTCSFIYRNNLATTYCNIFFKNLFCFIFGKKRKPTLYMYYDHRNMFS